MLPSALSSLIDNINYKLLLLVDGSEVYLTKG